MGIKDLQPVDENQMNYMSETLTTSPPKYEYCVVRGFQNLKANDENMDQCYIDHLKQINDKAQKGWEIVFF